jgi:thioredoxin reductase (NADPH)
MAALEAERWLAHHGIGETPVLETGESSIAAAAAEG